VIEATKTGGEAPADGGATSPDDIETATATEVNANQCLEDAESLLAMVEDVRPPMEATVRAEVPEVWFGLRALGYFFIAYVL
jgi:hypothetical protein